jgi:hypothetical protein
MMQFLIVITPFERIKSSHFTEVAVDIIVIHVKALVTKRDGLTSSFWLNVDFGNVNVADVAS